MASTNISQEYYDELKQAFDFFDKDGDGISKEELQQAMLTFGKNPDEEELDAMIEAADQDGNGVIEFAEFL